ncbi:MAG: hypothetical protein GYA17_02110 [Chloroflexi bacterium]|nr:hypothetical protein [Chloroflexota bacterium]
MAHDEVNHVVPSFDLYEGRGYRHDPITHGPMQFHLIALSFFLLGDSDFSARVPAAVFSVAAVAAVLFLFKRYLGRSGTLVAGFLYLISPFLLFYGRYTRNEAFIELFAVLTLYGVLRYLEKGDRWSLLLLTVVTALQFITKETAYIYTAQLLLFMGVLFLEGIARLRWPTPQARERFIWLMGAALLLFGLVLGYATWSASKAISAVDGTTPAGPALPGTSGVPIVAIEALGVVLAAGIAVAGFVLLIRHLGWAAIRKQRSFDIIILIGSLILPLLSAFPVKMVGWDPLDYSSAGAARTAIFVVLTTLLAVGIGLWWRPRFWVYNAAIFYAIFTVFYTTLFTNGQGFFTGLVGSLGYWLSQQGVERGSQPWYYFGLIQIPIYEYLGAIGAMLAVYFGIRYRRFATVPGASPAHAPETSGPIEPVLQDSEEAPDTATDELPVEDRPAAVPTLSLLVFWTVTSLVAYSVAGEKMPWLTVHISLPLLLTAGWGIGYLIDLIPWKEALNHKSVVALVLIPVFLLSLLGTLGSLLGAQPPFQGNTLEQLQTTSTFLLALAAAVFSGGFLVYTALQLSNHGHLGKLVGVGFFAVLAFLTVRTTIMASFINYDDATEFLVYAHAARGPKDVLEQIEEISRRTTQGLDIAVAYDNDGLYPYWWYLRHYPNHRWFTDQPTRDLADVPLIISSDATNGKMEPIVRDNYIDFQYVRLWWPMQDYFNLTWDRIWGALSDANMRSALFQIWLNRDYTQYAQLTNSSSLTLETWQPSSRMHFYVRKDVAAQMWNYGVAAAAPVTEVVDPYKDTLAPLTPDLTIGSTGNNSGQLLKPRGVAMAPDGSIYVSDAGNNRIEHFSVQGELMDVWGSFADVSQGSAPGGTFYEPWGIAVAEDGSVFVADTWNHRVQKFTADGQFVQMWGYFGQAEQPDAFWGPRDIAIDSQGRVYVTDTGNKRVVLFTQDGEYVGQFGSAGLEAGQFDEPVGIAIDDNDLVYIVDTWNQRVQVMASSQDGSAFVPVRSWDVYGWFGQSLENKPFIDVDSAGNVYITDPEAVRLLEFDAQGNYLRGWVGDYTGDGNTANVLTGVTVDQDDRVWVTEAGRNHVLRLSALP